MVFPPEWARFAPKPRALSDGNKWNVFLSYRSVNRPWVLNLYDVLRGQGHEVFLDQVVLTAGDQLTRKLQDALAASQAGVLVWSNATRDSDWVRDEYEVMQERARRQKEFKFVPVKLDDSDLPPFVDLRLFLDFKGYPDGPNGGELLRLLHAVVGIPLGAEAARFASEQDELAKQASARIEAAIANGNAGRLLQLFAENELPWHVSASLGCKAAEGLTKLGRNDDAIQMLETLEQRFPRAIRPKQLRALALARRARGNDLDNAQEIMGELYQLGEKDPETLGIYGRTWMDRYAKSGDTKDLKRSRDLYDEAFAGAEDDFYTGINAAAKSVLLGAPGDLASAAEYARRVQEIVGTAVHPDDYWMTATVGEVLLIQKKYADAARLYQAAVDEAPEEIGSHQTTWKQACRLMAKLQPGADEAALIRKVFAHLPDCDKV